MWAERRTSVLLALIVAALASCVAATSASACSCIRAHPAMVLPEAEAAIVGVVESNERVGNTFSHVMRVERALKGAVGERVTVESGFTSCQISIAAGTRVGLFLTKGAHGEWTAGSCGVTDADTLLAAAELPRPAGSGRFIATVDAPTVGAVALTADGRAAGYALSDGKPLASAPCGDGAVQATRARDGRVLVGRQYLPHLGGEAFGEVALDKVAALGCTDGGRTLWVAGPKGDQFELLSLRAGTPPRRELRRPASAAAIVGSKAYFSHPGLFRVIPLTGRRLLRGTRHEGQFAQFSVSGSRVAGRLRDGRAAILDLRTGRLRTGARSGAVVWLTGDRLLAGRTILNRQLRVVRSIDGRLGRVVGVDRGTAYLAEGRTLRRLRSGAKRATIFSRLPGKVVGLTPAAPSARFSWHSCEKSAKTP